MGRAVFLDYMGTVIQNTGDDMMAASIRIIKNSEIGGFLHFVEIWWKIIERNEMQTYGDTFLSQEEIVREAIKYFEKRYRLRDNRDELIELMKAHWSNAPLYPDVIPFFNECPFPIYIVCNNSEELVAKRVMTAGLNVAGIISGETCRAYKPRKEIFQRALAVSRLRPKDVMYIGTSYENDYKAARDQGMNVLLLDRKDKNKELPSDCKITNLMEALQL